MPTQTAPDFVSPDIPAALPHDILHQQDVILRAGLSAFDTQPLAPAPGTPHPPLPAPSAPPTVLSPVAGREERRLDLVNMCYRTFKELHEANRSAANRRADGNGRNCHGLWKQTLTSQQPVAPDLKSEMQARGKDQLRRARMDQNQLGPDPRNCLVFFPRP